MRRVLGRVLGIVLLGLAVEMEAGPAGAQSLPFQVRVTAIAPPASMPALHSMAYAERHGYWVFLGGRTDGLHGPFGGTPDTHFFPWDKANKLIWVVHPEQGKVWWISLPTKWRFVLSASNTQHHFDSRKGRLYVLGGYGASAEGFDPKLVTFDSAASLDVDGLIARLNRDFGSGGSVPESVPAEFLRVRTGVSPARLTGGRLEHIPGEDRYYLFFGHECVGEYCGGAGGFQKYSFEIRSFRIVDTPEGPDLRDLQVFTTAEVPELPTDCQDAAGGNVKVLRQDETTTRIQSPGGRVFEIAEPEDHDSQYRRRDLNSGPIRVPGESPDGVAGVAAYGGVFTKKRPPSGFGYAYLNPVYVAGGAPPALDTFRQRLSHYETALLPVWDPGSQTMHTVFFGGLSLYLYKNGSFTCDVEIPFIDTISVLSRNAAGSKETVLPEALPGLLGTNSAFLRNAKAEPHFYDNGVLNLGSLRPGEPVTAGFLFGGIEKSGTKSAATNKIFAVSLVRRPG
ncbi:MAG TPA: hypothetical protein VLT87_27975 [Thermoanaerobaculia bacterium]|nr:hypothetical protein [Thermoanaerobaculia bacterium]